MINKYRGICKSCGVAVAAGAGTVKKIERWSRSWSIAAARCSGAGAEPGGRCRAGGPEPSRGAGAEGPTHTGAGGRGGAGAGGGAVARFLLGQATCQVDGMVSALARFMPGARGAGAGRWHDFC
jgi:hypothetical protein